MHLIDLINATLKVGALAIAVVIGAIIAAAVAQILESSKAADSRERFRVLLAAALSFGALAAAIGMITSVSRSPAVGDVMPAVLTLIGGVALYLFTHEERRSSVVAAMTSFALMLVFGIVLGGYERQRAEIDISGRAYDLPTRINQAKKEHYINSYRAAYGLPEIDF